MAWKIEFSTRADKQLRKLDKQIVRRILSFLKTKVEAEPRSIGKYSKGNLSDLWSYRVGEYRLICNFEDERLVIFVLEIGHRREVYEKTDL